MNNKIYRGYLDDTPDEIYNKIMEYIFTNNKIIKTNLSLEFYSMKLFNKFTFSDNNKYNLFKCITKKRNNKSIIDSITFFPLVIKNWWLYIDSSIEMYYKNWVIFSLDEMTSIYNNYLIYQQIFILDIAYLYESRGWLFVIALDINSGKLFLRLDGGSNAYDREYNLEKVIKFIPKVNSKYMNIEEFFNILENNQSLYDICVNYHKIN